MKWFFFALLLLVCWSSSAEDLDKSERVTQQPLRVGAILPLSGEAAFWGKNPRRGIELALRDLSGAEQAIEVFFEDDSCQAAKAVSAFQQLTRVRKVDLILGPVCSSAALAVAPLARKAAVPMLVFSETDSITSVAENIFRLWVPNGRQGVAVAEQLVKDKIKKLALLGIDNDYSVAVLGALKKRFQELGGSIVADERYQAKELDLRAEITRIESRAPEAIFVAAYIKDAVIVLKRLREMKFQGQLYFSGTVHNPEFFESVGPLANGITFADLEDSTQLSFQKRWESEFQEEWPGLTSGASLFYDMTHFLNQQGLMGNRGSESLTRALSGLELKGVASGSLSFTESRDLSRVHALYTVKNEEVERLVR